MSLNLGKKQVGRVLGGAKGNITRKLWACCHAAQHARPDTLQTSVLMCMPIKEGLHEQGMKPTKIKFVNLVSLFQFGEPSENSEAIRQACSQNDSQLETNAM